MTPWACSKAKELWGSCHSRGKSGAGGARRAASQSTDRGGVSRHLWWWSRGSTRTGPRWRSSSGAQTRQAGAPSGRAEKGARAREEGRHRGEAWPRQSSWRRRDSLDEAGVGEELGGRDVKERRQGMVMAPGAPTAAPVVEQRGGIAASGWFRRGGVVRMLTEVEAKRGRGVGVGCSRGFAAGSGSLSSAWAVARDEEREMS